MVETKPGQAPVEPRDLRLNIRNKETVSANSEIQEVRKWYQERLRELPEFKVTEAPITDGEKWTHALTPEGQLDKVVGAHFGVIGAHIESTFSWNQPLVRQRTETAYSLEGDEIKISGIVLLVKDPQNKVLLTVAQEPGVDRVDVEGKELHPVLRSPVQTSVEKLKQLEKGNEKVDPVLAKVLSSLARDGQTIRDVIENIPLEKIPTDGNRIEANVYYGLLAISQELSDDLVQNEAIKFLSKEQYEALPLNGHTQIALSVARE